MESLRILVVEDDYRFTQRLERHIQKLGHQVMDKTTNVEDAIIAFNKNQPDLIIMDIELGDNREGGIELTKTFNKMGNIPIIYYSDYLNNKTIRQKAAKTNSIAILSKSHSVDDLEANIYRVINLRNRVDNESEVFKKRFNTLFDTVDSIQQKLNSLYQFLVFPFSNNSFWITAKGGFPTRVFYSDLCWIQTFEQKDTVRIVLDKEIIEFGVNLTSFERKVRHPSLVRIHKSCIINIDKARRLLIPSKEIVIKIGSKEERLRYSDTYIKDIKEKINMVGTK